MRCAPFCWLLFDANWAHTRQSRDLIQHCCRILPIGRVRWIPGSPYTGKDDASGIGSNKRTRSGRFCFVSGVTTERTKLARASSAARHIRCSADTRFCSNACRQRAYRDRIAVTVSVTEEPRFNNLHISRLGHSCLAFSAILCILGPIPRNGGDVLGFIRVSNLVFELCFRNRSSQGGRRR